ncbi:dNTP triphosphohydrolase [Haloferax mediterranei ATCC 33500]|uniref:DGTPase n=1 Tax=Haloferax mediterranei (strain ATCC 33500 / DSM 1411 / JCM 8866 / NBRC 14739 / NCIMB 2177 / R-4) TaxID=523841 RepID=I3R255_HALMT|nr:dNTP triphosphohydrolase [Haloferax mediterranei]AFK18315.1 dGTPase [Haloferax mediterranei ATCC 33500]MDX5988403.1 dNTP triphosphohydrolase [Haloferax mediterranei ATCC 33500]QCQ74830.1 dNTP triphosphohydrolase [Haloferax mediterranei ATCC 33500]
MRTDRQYTETEEEYRSAFRRDRDRITYAPEFRRLKDVTQIAHVGESYLYHDRLTHSLKVAQVGESIAELLRQEYAHQQIERELDTQVVIAACYAHDIGHPPFGHVAERELNRLLQEEHTPNELGFEGNAQTFRILTRLANHREEGFGLNLTRATLNATIKYPWARSEKPNKDKWGYYKSEKEAFEFAREGSNRTEKQSLEAQIMEYADDVTYAVHDIDDFYRSGLIPLDRLLVEAEQNYRVDEETSNIEQYLREEGKEEIADNVRRVLNDINSNYARDPLKCPYTNSEEQRIAIAQFDSNLISDFINGSEGTEPPIIIDLTDDEFDLERDDNVEETIQVLKHITRYYVLSNPSLNAQRHGQRRIIRVVFNALYEESGKPGISAIPEPYRDRLQENLKVATETQNARVVADMITSMTEKQVSAMYKRLQGHSPGSLVDEIVR